MLDSRSAKATVALVDDHPVVIRGLRDLLVGSRFNVVWQAQNRDDCLALGKRTDPDIIVLDLRIGEDLAPDVYRELRSNGLKARWVVLTGHEDTALLRACLDLGASGILLKDTLELEIVQSLTRVLAGALVLDPRLKTLASPELGHRRSRAAETELTARERDVLRLVERGMTSRQISTSLDLSLNTVRSYVQSVLMKLDAHTRVEAIATARRLRLM